MKKRLKEDGLKYNKKFPDVKYLPKNPFSAVDYRIKLYTSMECNEDHESFYHKLIGNLRWVIDLGYIDIAFEVSVLSRYLAFSRTGHLVQALHVFKYLEMHNANDLAFDPCYHHVTSDQNI